VIEEIRHYSLHDGMLPAMLDRFKKINMVLFERHGIELTRSWLHVDDDRMFSFAAVFADLDDRERAWAAYHNDPLFIENKETQATIIKTIELHVLEPHEW